MPAPERIPTRRLTSPAPSAVETGSASVPPREAAPTAEGLLTDGELVVRGQIREASNAVLYCTVTAESTSRACVYKPVAGERPLWDFPDGTLAQREVAAFEISRATGWDLVPATVLRDGPFGPGMVQEWIELGQTVVEGPEDAGEPEGPSADAGPDVDGGVDGPAGDRAAPDGGTPAQDLVEAGLDEDGEDDEEEDPDDVLDLGLGPLLAVVEAETPGPGWKAIGLVEVGEGRTALLVHADDERLRRLAVLDAVINNGDRKGGHLLPTPEGRLYAIDHGVTFHAENKLRTLLWGWAGEPLTEEAKTTLARLARELSAGEPLAERLAQLITPAELDALRERVAALLRTGLHPLPSGDWPAIPWPPM